MKDIDEMDIYYYLQLIGRKSKDAVKAHDLALDQMGM